MCRLEDVLGWSPHRLTYVIVMSTNVWMCWADPHIADVCNIWKIFLVYVQYSGNLWDVLGSSPHWLISSAHTLASVTLQSDTAALSLARSGTITGFRTNFLTAPLAHSCTTPLLKTLPLKQENSVGMIPASPSLTTIGNKFLLMCWVDPHIRLHKSSI